MDGFSHGNLSVSVSEMSQELVAPRIPAEMIGFQNAAKAVFSAAVNCKNHKCTNLGKGR